MKRYNFVLVPALSAMLAAAATAAPENLIKNGNFEEIRDGEAVGWEISNKPEIMRKRFPFEESSGRIAQIELLKWDPSGIYLSQSVKVQPNTQYRFSFKARMDQGNMRFAVTGGTGDSKVSISRFGIASRFSMFPLFWDEDWSQHLVFPSDEWRNVSFDFNSGNATRLHIAMGVYQRVGTASFDDVSLTKIEKEDN